MHICSGYHIAMRSVYHGRRRDICSGKEGGVSEWEISYMRGIKSTKKGKFVIVFFWILFIVVRLGKEEIHHLVYMYPIICSSNHTPFPQEVSIIMGTEEGPSEHFLQREEKSIDLFMGRRHLPHAHKSSHRLLFLRGDKSPPQTNTRVWWRIITNTIRVRGGEIT